MTDVLNKLTAGEITLLVSVIGLGGAAIGAGSSFLASQLTRRTEERRHYRELGIKVAMTKFDQHCQLAQKLANATGTVVPTPPFNAFLIDGIRLTEIISDSRLSAEEIGAQIARLTDFTNEVTNTIKKQQNNAQPSDCS